MSNINQTTAIANLCALDEQLFTEVTPEQAVMVEGGLKLGISHIKAIQAGADTFGDDDTVINVNGERIFGPVGMSTGETADVVKLLNTPGSSAKIELFDLDGGLNGPKDSLGSFTARSTNGRLENEIVSGGGSIYQVFYRAD